MLYTLYRRVFGQTFLGPNKSENWQSEATATAHIIQLDFAEKCQK